MLLIGSAAAISGGAVMAIFGGDGKLTSSPEHLSTTTRAFVTRLDDIDGIPGLAKTIGHPRLHLSVTKSEREIFIGIGPADAVDRYLAGATVDEVTDLNFDPFELDTTRHAGSVTPQHPGAQTFWLAQSNGTGSGFDWKVTDGNYRVVVMNADASSGIQFDGRLGVTVPHLFGIGLGALVAGLISSLIGLWVLVSGLRQAQDDRRPAQPSYFANSR
jgi:hypothetical protein